MQQKDPGQVYREELKKHQQNLDLHLQKRRRLGWLRLAFFLLTIIISQQVFVNFGLWGIAAVVTGIGILLFLVSKDVNNNQAIANLRLLLQINREELEYLQHHFHQHYDGADLAPGLHDYSNDLDLFGKASLFQFINRSYTEQGRKQLAADLLQPLPAPAILQRQEAIKELAPMVGWRQQLQAIAMANPVRSATQSQASAWVKEENRLFTGTGWRIFTWFYTLVTIGSAVATALGYLPIGIFSFLFALFFTTAVLLSRNTIRPYIQLGGIVKEIGTLEKMMAWAEGKSFHSQLLQQLLGNASSEGNKASAEIKELKAILDRFDLRISIVGVLFLNPFLLWDIRQMMALNNWRTRNRKNLDNWFILLKELEVLNSFSTLYFNHPDWIFPIIAEKDFVYHSLGLGHPLISPASRVNNDLFIEGKPAIGLITGSNMAGKSTFLRSVGINLVLAQAGSAVCAQAFSFSPVKLMSSMRIADDLSENTSTFYAELKKLKSIIEAVNRKEPLLILLDEILRGTNSYDRHTGSAALIRQLVKENAVALIATHDVELARIRDEHPAAIRNYHFDVQVEGEELYFDYRLKSGVCQSLNASILMKKIGIRLDDPS